MNSCPICGKTSQFLSSRRKDEICRLCGSSERHRLVWVFLKDHTDLFNGLFKHMLHVAPEECFEQRFKLALHGGYVSIDKSHGKAMFVMDITNIQFPSEHFDVAYCSHVLEHIEDDKLAIREMCRVMKRDGWAIINVPVSGRLKTFEKKTNSAEEREKLFGQGDHVRVYGKDFLQRLKKAGFLVSVIKAKDFLTKAQREQMGISKLSGDIYFCRKKGS